MTLYYCYDAYCGWCYGFSNVMKKIAATYENQFFIEVLSGGMILPTTPQHIGVTAAYIQNAYKNVESYSGVTFGDDYLWHINNPELSDWFPNSEMPAIALSILKEQLPNKQVLIASDFQYALHFEGRDLTDKEAYRHLLEKYKIDETDFYNKLSSETYKEKAYYEFALCKQLQVQGYPSLLLQASESKFYLVSNGYTSFENVQARIENILKANS
jgi:putative protein-disulfide isomerase